MSLNQRIDEITHEKKHYHFFKQYFSELFLIKSRTFFKQFLFNEMNFDKTNVDQIEIVEQFDVRHFYKRTKTLQRFQKSLKRHDEMNL